MQYSNEEGYNKGYNNIFISVPNCYSGLNEKRCQLSTTTIHLGKLSSFFSLLKYDTTKKGRISNWRTKKSRNFQWNSNKGKGSAFESPDIEMSSKKRFISEPLRVIIFFSLLLKFDNLKFLFWLSLRFE